MAVLVEQIEILIPEYGNTPVSLPLDQVDPYALLEDGSDREFADLSMNNGLELEKRSFGRAKGIVCLGIDTPAWERDKDTLIEKIRLVIPRSRARLQRHTKGWESLLRVQEWRGVARRISGRPQVDDTVDVAEGMGITESSTVEGSTPNLDPMTEILQPRMWSVRPGGVYLSAYSQ